jgi:pimeloyl-ACP methyl ester carboxylesterase
VVALAAIAAGFLGLRSASAGLAVAYTNLGSIPVTIFRPQSGGRAPVIVIAHGFAGSQQLMQPFAITLARNGYVAVTFDFPGHGRNPLPMGGGLTNDAARGALLLDTLDRVVSYARTLPFGDGRVALLGHSMASDIVVRYAEAHPAIPATVAVSLFSSGITATSPRNLLVIDGALEPAMLTDEAYRVVGMEAAGHATARVTYGDFSAGTARRLSLSGGVEHIGVLFSRQSMREALGWINQAFGRRSEGYLDHRGPPLAMLFAGLVALAWPLSRLLPIVSAVPRGAAIRWRGWALVAVAPAVLTPLLLWKLPTDFLPILLGDYLAVHFALYGLLTVVAMRLVRRHAAPAVDSSLPWRRIMLAAGAIATYSVVVIGTPINAYITSFMPIAVRVPLILAMLAGTLPYFIADEWATRGAGAPWGGYALTKICFLASLVLAVTLNLQRLFFLIIIVPVILIFFVVYGLFSTWAFRRTQNPLVGAFANAMAFAWAIAVTFPVVG